jgi:hypothetical protein
MSRQVAAQPKSTPTMTPTKIFLLASSYSCPQIRSLSRHSDLARLFCERRLFVRVAKSRGWHRRCSAVTHPVCVLGRGTGQDRLCNALPARAVALRRRHAHDPQLGRNIYPSRRRWSSCWRASAMATSLKGAAMRALVHRRDCCRAFSLLEKEGPALITVELIVVAWAQHSWEFSHTKICPLAR